MCFETFPNGYTYLDKIDLQHNKKQFWLVNGISFLLLALMLVAGYFIDNITQIEESAELFIAIAVLIVGYVLYIVLHEATHGLVMRLSVKAKLNFGFKGWAAYAGSTGYFDKNHYIAIALAPLILWGIVFGILNFFFRSGMWFWVIWILQTGNVSGAAGDLFCTYKMFRYPKDILVRDSGTEMLIFRRQTEDELAAESDKKQKDEVQAEIRGDLTDD